MTHVRPLRAPGLLLLAACLLLPASAGCGGGGGDSPTEPLPRVSFTAAGPAPAVGASLEQAPGEPRGGPAGDRPLLSLRFLLHDLPEVDEIAFRITYPSELLTFAEATPGDFLSSRGSADLVTVSDSPGTTTVRVVISGAPVAGSGLLATFDYLLERVGTGTITVEPVVPIPGASWVGGTFTIRP